MRFLLIPLIILLSYHSFGQVTIIDSGSIALKSNEIAIVDSRHHIQVYLSSFLFGSLEASYNLKVNKFIGIEIGGGVFLGYYSPKIHEPFAESFAMSNPNSGFSFFAHPKIYYFTGRAPEDWYNSILYRLRRFTDNNRTLDYHDLVLNAGFNHFGDSKIGLCVSLGQGLRLITNPNAITKTDKFVDLQYIVPITFSLMFLL